MRLTPSDRLGFQRDLADTRLDSRKIVLVLPQFVEADFDEFSQSGLSVDLGDGTGRQVSFITYELFANVRNVDAALQTFGQVPPGAVVGDVFLSVGARDKSVIDQGMINEHAYYFIDGGTWVSTAISAAGVGHAEEWIVTLKTVRPKHRARGY